MPDVWDNMWSDLRGKELEEVGLYEMLGKNCGEYDGFEIKEIKWKKMRQCYCGNKYIQICEEQEVCPTCAREAGAWWFYTKIQKKEIKKIGNVYYAECEKCRGKIRPMERFCSSCIARISKKNK
jgi:hypothetical protein